MAHSTLLPEKKSTCLKRTKSMTRTHKNTNRIAVALVSLLFAASAGSLMAATTLQLGFEEPGSVNESNRSVFLTWGAEAGSVYKVQSSSNLASGSVWTTEEPVLATGGIPVRWSAPEVLGDARFYRLMQEPEITGIEPAMISTDGGTVYLLGHSLSTNGSLRIAGIVLPPNVLQPGSTYSFVMPPLSAGIYDVDWLENGQVVATGYKLFSVTGQPTPVGEARNLFEPPSPPLAMPALMKAKEKANQVKSMSNLGGRRIGANQRGGISLFDGSNGKVQEGKKGLNAVNVKLARMAGSWGGFDDTDTSAMSWGGNDDSDLSSRVATATCGSGLCRVQLCSGEIQVEALDMVIPGRGLDFILGRTYRSRSAARPGMSYGWTLSCDVSVAQTSDGIAVFDGSGRRDVYFPGTNGVYACGELFNEGSMTKGVFTLTFPDTGRWEFNPMDGSVTAGKLARSVDRNGNRMLYLYGGLGQLTDVVDDLDRTNHFSYDSAGLLAAVTDFSGRSVTYHYYGTGETGGSPGDLKSVTTPAVTGTPNKNDFPNGKTTTYTYSSGFPITADRENHLLLSIVDPKGQTSLACVYQHNQTDLEFLRCISITEGSGSVSGVTTVKYLAQVPSPANGFAIVRAIVRDSVGNVMECFYDSRNRCVRQRDFTGRALLTATTTDTDNRPTGKVRASDPDFYDTVWTWNLDSLCTKITYPGGNATVCLYERDFDKSAGPRNKGDLRIYREVACCSGGDTDGDGVPDTTELTTSFQYDPRFGSPSSYASMDAFSTGVARLGRPAVNELYAEMAPTASKHAINTKGTGTGGRLLPTVNKHAITTKGTGSSGRLLPTVNKHAINTKGTGTAGRLLPTVNKHAINTKGTGTAGRAGGGFVTVLMDPRGNVVTCTYDARGNPVKTVSISVSSCGANAPTVDRVFNSYGQLIAVTNAPDGNCQRPVDAFSYYTNGPQAGYLQSCTEDAGGLALTCSFEYDPRGNLARYVDPRTNDWLYVFNALDQCMRIQTPVNLTARCVTDCAYDANDNVVQCSVEVRDDTDTKLGNQISSFAYDQKDRLIQVTAPISVTTSAVTEFAYDGNDQCILVRSPEAVAGHDPLSVATCVYDERRLPFQEIQGPGLPNGTLTQSDYDANGYCLRLVVTDSTGLASAPKVCAFGYDGFSRCVSATDAMGNVATCAYDRNGNLIYTRCDGQTNDVAGSTGNRRLCETRYKYDALDRCTRVSDSFFDISTGLPVGDGLSVTAFSYAPNGQLLTVTDDNGHTTTCAYDSAGRPAVLTDARGNFTITVRDAFGNVNSRSSVELPDRTGAEQVFTTTCTYDTLNRLVSCADNVGNTVHYLYDSRDNVLRVTDARGNDTVCTYDGLSRCLGSVNYVGSWDAGITINTTHVEYDSNSRVLSSTDGNGNMTRYAYDPLGRCTGITNADNTTHKLIWSPRSNLVGEQDANGTVISNSFDLDDRCIRRDITPAAGVAATTTVETFAYDGLSRCVMASNDVSRIECAYDSLGNSVSGSQDGIGQSAAFDAVGNCLSLTYPGGQVVTYAYDMLDRITNVATFNGGVSHAHLAAFGYDGPDRLSRIVRDNNVGTLIGWDGAANPANATGDFGWQQVSRVSHQVVGNGGAVIDRRGFAYDPEQNKTVRAQTDPFVVGQLTLTNAFEYTAVNQLSRAINTKGTGSNFRTYNLDGEGNRLSVIRDGVVEAYSRDTGLPSPADFQMNQYTTTPFGSQVYDENGNIVARLSSAQQLEYQYDCADRLVAVNDFTTGSSVPLVSFTYDALGHRISKTSYPPAPAAPVTTQYLQRLGGNILIHGDDSILEAREGGNLIDSYVHKLDDGVMLARFKAGGELAHYHCDDLGNVLALTDAQGAVLERCEYDDYGQPQFLAADGSPLVDSTGQPVTASPQGNPFLFRGMFWDAESGLYCEAGSGGSYLDPKTGRLTRRYCDNPVHADRCGTASACTFAGNNPWSAGDCNVIKGCWIGLDASGAAPQQAIRGKVRSIKADPMGRSSVGNGSAGVFLSRACLSREILKSFFERGDRPTQAQFAALIDSTLSYQSTKGKSGAPAK
jgi:YD repeat-containing protein